MQELLFLSHEPPQRVCLLEAHADQVEGVVQLHRHVALGQLLGLQLREDHLPPHTVGEVHHDDVRLLLRLFAHVFRGQPQEAPHDGALADALVAYECDFEHVAVDRLFEAAEVGLGAGERGLLGDVHDAGELLFETDVVEVLVGVGVVRVGQVAAEPRLPPEHLPLGQSQPAVVVEGRVLEQVRLGEGCVSPEYSPWGRRSSRASRETATRALRTC